MSQKSGTSLTDTSGERGMVKVMGMIIVSLLLLALFLVSMARLLGVGRDDDENDPLMRNALISRLEPVGAVRTSAADLEQVASAAGGGSDRSGEELVQGVCAGCHEAGAGGAPLLGDEEAWAERRELGLDTLVASVVNGKGSMPAGGGSDYSEDEIRRAVQHIALFEDTDEATAAGGEGESAETVEASATTMTEEAKDGEAVATNEVPSGGQVAPADDAVEGTAMAADPAGAASEAATDVVDGSTARPENDMKAQSDTAEENDMSAKAGNGAAEGGVVTTRDLPGDAEETGELAEAAVASDVGTAPPQADMGPEALVALIATGHEPEGLTDDIKAQVNGVCAGCHVAGVAGAPKLGDKDAWAERAELGLAALSQSVIKGKGVMPARGGSTLTDEQMPLAIQYQMGKKP